MLRKLTIVLVAAAAIGVTAIPTAASAHGSRGWYGYHGGYSCYGWHGRLGWHGRRGWRGRDGWCYHGGWRHHWYVPAWHGWRWL